MSTPPWERTLQARRARPDLTLDALARRLDLSRASVSMHLRQARLAGEEVPYTGGTYPLPVEPARIAAALSPAQSRLLRAVADGLVVSRFADGGWYAVRTDANPRHGGARVAKTAQGLAQRRLAAPADEPDEGSAEGSAGAADRARAWRLTELGEQVLAVVRDGQDPARADQAGRDAGTECADG